MTIRRGQIWLTVFGTPRGSSPGYKRPAVVIQSDGFNKTDIDSVVVASVTTTSRFGKMPGNVEVAGGVGGLREDSVINVTQIYTVDRSDLLELWGILPKAKLKELEKGLRLVLALPQNIE